MTAARSPTGLAVRRVLAAFGPSTASSRALEAAVEFAARIGAELDALFVEDERLLGLAELPFVRQVSLSAVTGRPVGRSQLELELRALARAVERRLLAAASRRQIRVTFRVARGELAAAIGTAAEEVDLLIIESVSRPLAREARLELAARAVVRRVSRSVLLVNPAQTIGGPIHVVIDGGDKEMRALRVGVDLTERFAGPLVVTVLGPDAERRRALIQDAAARLAGLPMVIAYRTMTGTDPAEVQALLAAVGHGTLVVDAASALLAPESAWERIACAPCAVLLLR